MSHEGQIPIMYVDPKFEQRLKRKREKQRIYDRRKRDLTTKATLNHVKIDSKENFAIAASMVGSSKRKAAKGSTRAEKRSESTASSGYRSIPRNVDVNQSIQIPTPTDKLTELYNQDPIYNASSTQFPLPTNIQTSAGVSVEHPRGFPSEIRPNPTQMTPPLSTDEIAYGLPGNMPPIASGIPNPDIPRNIAPMPPKAYGMAEYRFNQQPAFNVLDHTSFTAPPPLDDTEPSDVGLEFQEAQTPLLFSDAEAVTTPKRDSFSYEPESRAHPIHRVCIREDNEYLNQFAADFGLESLQGGSNSNMGFERYDHGVKRPFDYSIKYYTDADQHAYDSWGSPSFKSSDRNKRAAVGSFVPEPSLVKPSTDESANETLYREVFESYKDQPYNAPSLMERAH